MSTNGMRTSLQLRPKAQRSALVSHEEKRTYSVRFNEDLMICFQVVVRAVDQICKDLTARNATKPIGFRVALQQCSRCCNATQIVHDCIHLPVVFPRPNVFQGSFDIKSCFENSPAIFRFGADAKAKNRYVAAITLESEVVDCVY